MRNFFLTILVMAMTAACANLGESGSESGNEGSGEGGNESSGEHGAGGEGPESGGGGEESATTYQLHETYDMVRAGAHLVLRYDAAAEVFTGSVTNTTDATLDRVRVEVHLSNGVELGPTSPRDLAPGQTIPITLDATGQVFTTWGAHPEVGSGAGETGAHGSGVDIQTRALAAVASETLLTALDSIGARFADPIHDVNLTRAGQQQTFRPAGSRGIELSELLRSTPFSAQLAGAGSGIGLSPGLRWALWGGGNGGAFQDGSRHDGELTTAWLGVDARSRRGVAGLALSHGISESDYGFGLESDAPGGLDSLETRLTAIYPYGRLRFDNGVELQGLLGAGRGEASFLTTGVAPEATDLSMALGSVGARWDMTSFGAFDLAAHADANFVRMQTGGEQAVSDLTAEVWRGRAGLEVSRSFTLGGQTALRPFLEVAGTRDGGDWLMGNGFEVVGGVRFSSPRIHVEARGRTLVAHTAENASQQSASLVVRFQPQAGGRGLSLSLMPRWATPGVVGSEALWLDQAPRLSGLGSGAGGTFDSRVGYGFVTRHGLLTPFVETGAGGGSGSRRHKIGFQFDAARSNLTLDFYGERRENVGMKPLHGVWIDLNFRF